MFQPLMTFVFPLLAGLAGVAACAWVIASGQAFTMDGLLTMAIGLVVGGIFGASVVWAWHTGELSETFRKFRARHAEAAALADASRKGEV